MSEEYRDNNISIQQAFEQMAQEMRSLSVQLVRLRYLTGEMHVKELMQAIKTVGEWNKQPIDDLQLIEIVERINQERDAFYKRVVAGAADADRPKS